jgi:Ca2+-dependent lipid-binding protein
MWEDIDDANKKRFIMSTFVYIPIIFIGGLLLTYVLGKFIGLEISLGAAIFVIFICMLVCVFSITRFYYKLSKDVSQAKKIEKNKNVMDS